MPKKRQSKKHDFTSTEFLSHKTQNRMMQMEEEENTNKKLPVKKKGEPIIKILLDSPGKLAEDAPDDPDDAVAYYSTQVKRIVPTKSPVEWAFCQYSLGLQLLIRRGDTAKGSTYTLTALQNFSKAMSVYTPDEFVGMHALLQALTGVLYREQAAAVLASSAVPVRTTPAKAASSADAAGNTDGGSRGLTALLRLVGQSLENLVKAASVFSEHARFTCESLVVAAETGSLYLLHAEALLNRNLQKAADAEAKSGAAGNGNGAGLASKGARPVTKWKTRRQMLLEAINLLEQAVWYFESALSLANKYRVLLRSKDSDKYSLWVPDSDGEDEESSIPLHLEALLGGDSLSAFEARCSYKLGIVYMSLGGTETTLLRYSTAGGSHGKHEAAGKRPSTAATFDDAAARERFKSACEIFCTILENEQLPKDTKEEIDVYCRLALIALHIPGALTECGEVKETTLMTMPTKKGAKTVVAENGIQLASPQRDEELKSAISYIEAVLASPYCDKDQQQERRAHFICAQLQTARVGLLLDKADSTFTPVRGGGDPSSGGPVFGEFEGLQVLRSAIAQLNTLKSLSKGVSKTAANLHMYYFCFVKLAEFSSQLATLDSEKSPKERVQLRKDAARLLFNAFKSRSPKDSLELHFIASSQLGHALGTQQPLSALRCYCRSLLCLAAIVSRNQYYPDALSHSTTFNPSRIVGLVNRRTAVALNLIQTSCNWIPLLKGGEGSPSVWKFQFDDNDVDVDDSISEDDNVAQTTAQKPTKGSDANWRGLWAPSAPPVTPVVPVAPASNSPERPTTALPPDLDPESVPIAPPNVPLPERPPTRQVPVPSSMLPVPLSPSTGKHLRDILHSRKKHVHGSHFSRSAVVCTPAANLTLALLIRLSKLQLLLRSNRLGLGSGHRAQSLRARLPHQIDEDLDMVRSILLDNDSGVGYLSFADLQSASPADAEFAFESKENVFKLMVALEPVLLEEIPRRLGGDLFLPAITCVSALNVLQDNSDPAMNDAQVLLGHASAAAAAASDEKADGPPEEKAADSSSDNDNDRTSDEHVKTRDKTLQSLWKSMKGKESELLRKENQALLIFYIAEGSQCLSAMLVWMEREELAAPSAPVSSPIPEQNTLPKTSAVPSVSVSVSEQTTPPKSSVTEQSSLPKSSLSGLMSSLGKALTAVKETAQTVQSAVKETAQNVQSAVKEHLPAIMSLDPFNSAKLRMETVISELTLTQVVALVQIYVEALQVRPAPRRASALSEALKDISNALGLSELLFPILPNNRPHGSAPVTELIISCPTLLRMLPWSCLPVVGSSSSTSPQRLTDPMSHTTSDKVVLDFFATCLGPSLAAIPVLASQRKSLERFAKRNRAKSRLCCLEGDRSPLALQDARVEMQAVVSVWDTNEEQSDGLHHCDVLTGSAVTTDRLTTRHLKEESSLNHTQGEFKSRLKPSSDIKNASDHDMRTGNRENGRKDNANNSRGRGQNEDSEGEEEGSSPEDAEKRHLSACLSSCRVLHICAASVMHTEAPQKKPKREGKRGSLQSNPSVSVPIQDKRVVDGDIGLLVNASTEDGSNPPLLTAKCVGQRLNLLNCALCVLSRSDFGSIFSTNTTSRRELLAVGDAIWDFLESFHFAGVCSILFPLWGSEAAGRVGLLAHALLMTRFYLELQSDISLVSAVEQSAVSVLKQSAADTSSEAPVTASIPRNNEASVTTTGVTNTAASVTSADDKEKQFQKGDTVSYSCTDTNGEKIVQSAIILEVHRDDTPWYFTIRIEATGVEKQTDAARLQIAVPTPTPTPVTQSVSPPQASPMNSAGATPADTAVALSSAKPPIVATKAASGIPTVTEALSRAQRWLRDVTVAEVDAFLTRTDLSNEVSSEFKHELWDLAGPSRVRKAGGEAESNGTAGSVNGNKKLFTSALHWGGMALSGEGGAVYTHVSEMASYRAKDVGAEAAASTAFKEPQQPIDASVEEEGTPDEDVYDDVLKQAKAARQKISTSVGTLVGGLKRRGESIAKDYRRRTIGGNGDGITEDSAVDAEAPIRSKPSHGGKAKALDSIQEDTAEAHVQVPRVEQAGDPSGEGVGVGGIGYGGIATSPEVGGKGVAAEAVVPRASKGCLLM